MHRPPRLLRRNPSIALLIKPATHLLVLGAATVNSAAEARVEPDLVVDLRHALAVCLRDAARAEHDVHLFESEALRGSVSEREGRGAGGERERRVAHLSLRHVIPNKRGPNKDHHAKEDEGAVFQVLDLY